MNYWQFIFDNVRYVSTSFNWKGLFFQAKILCSWNAELHLLSKLILKNKKAYGNPAKGERSGLWFCTGGMAFLLPNHVKEQNGWWEIYTVNM